VLEVRPHHSSEEANEQGKAYSHVGITRSYGIRGAKGVANKQEARTGSPEKQEARTSKAQLKSSADIKPVAIYRLQTKCRTDKYQKPNAASRGRGKNNP
jgi:hypothetical protein